MNVSERNLLRERWNELFYLIRYEKCADKKLLLKREQNAIDYKLNKCGDIELVADKVIIPDGQSTFTREHVFHGFTNHGMCIGEGCYWKRGGH